MNRAERRRGESAARKRRRWQRGILKFSRIAQGALESYVIAVSDYPLLLGAAACGDPTATALVRSVSMWAIEAAAPGADFLCLDCDQQFGPNIAAPAAFAISMPFANRDCAIVTGICERCAGKGEDLFQMALRRLRSIWPDAYSVAGGRA
jgi:hypothetical protein